MDLGNQLLLEENARLSHSMIWDWQSSYYATLGKTAMQLGVIPTFLTTNSFIATQYADLCYGLLEDMRQSGTLDLSEPVYLVELGAGHGKFAYLMLRRLTELMEADHKHNGHIPFVYVMTDFAENTVKSWQQHRCLKPLFAQGILDCAIYDAENDKELHLQYSKLKFGGKHNRPINKMIFIGNYLFDTLRHDAFRVVNKQLEEGLVTLTSPRESEPDLQDPTLIERFEVEWQYAPVAEPTTYYSGVEADLNSVLLALRDMFVNDEDSDASFMIPVGGLACVRNMFRQFGEDGFVLINGDKAYLERQEMKGLKDPHLAIHGSFSMMVNYAAIDLYFKQKQKPLSLHTTHLEGFKIAVFFADAVPDHEIHTAARRAFARLSEFSPDDFASLQAAVKEETQRPSLKLILSLLRLSHYDSDVFLKFKHCFIDNGALPFMKPRFLQDFKRAIVNVYTNYFPLSPTRDVAFEMGRLYMSMKDCTKAIEFFQDSLHDCGEHHVTYYNLGLCYNYIDDLTNAYNSFSQSVQRCPTYREAREWTERVAVKIKANRHNKG